MICIICGRQFEDKVFKNKIIIYCSRSCYYKYYYEEHKQQISIRQKEYHKKHYKYHPLPLKYKTSEEKQLVYKLRNKEYYKQHRDYYRQKNKQWYRDHKNDLDYKKRHKIAMDKYLKKKKQKDDEKFKERDRKRIHE